MGGIAPLGGSRFRASSDHKLQQTVGDTRVAFACPARSLPSLTMLAQTVVTNLTFVRAAKEDHAWLCNFFFSVSTYCFVSGFGVEMIQTKCDRFVDKK
jgi:hypothetical protein